MSKLHLSIFFIYIILFFKNFLYAHMYEQNGIEILHPYTTISDGNGNASAFITISNNTKNDIYLKNVITERSNMIMLMEGNDMTNSILIPANSIRSMDDFYIMLHKLTNELLEGENFNATLVFSSDIKINIKFVVGEGTTLSEDEDEEANHHNDHSHH